MKPGLTTKPRASIAFSACSGVSLIATILPSRMLTERTTSSCVSGLITLPSLIATSDDAGTLEHPNKHGRAAAKKS